MNSINHEESAHKLLSMKLNKEEWFLVADNILEICLK